MRRDRLTFHSFRKCFVGALERAGVDLAALSEVVEAVRYPGLKLT